MSYDFISKKKNETKITIINIYNKKNYANKSGYNISEDIRNDIENIAKEKNENIILLAGDFNSDKEWKNVNIRFFNFIEKIGFENFTKGEDFKNTMVPKARKYPYI